ncbi:DUF975 family protein [Longirhabdus pacifica]|uniref:DUF975 family protein n=1 Tax=Longirhabdus pacifica TaxID=2305227 RepID=UPI001008C275|nr:DUF975 family protein [Longirhabdus pacifica]
MKSSAEIRAAARNSMKGNWGIVLGSFVISNIIAGAVLSAFYIIWFIVLIIAIGFNGTPSDDSDFVFIFPFLSMIFFQIISYFIYFPLWFGQHSFSLQFIRNKKEMRYILDGFKKLGSAIIIYSYQFIGLLCIPIIWILIYVSERADYVFVEAFYVILTIGSFVPFLVAMYLMYRYVMAIYILRDNPQYGGKQALKKSVEMMYGHKFRLFKLHLSFLGWFALSFFTFGMLIIWLAPYMAMAQAHFYEELQGAQQQTRSNVVLNNGKREF